MLGRCSTCARHFIILRDHYEMELVPHLDVSFGIGLATERRLRETGYSDCQRHEKTRRQQETRYPTF
jgi:hypothetical protein